MRFSEKLPKLRKDNNYSQEQLADKLGVSRQAVSKWEAGNSYPDMDKLIQLCKILNCNLEDLMDDGIIGNEQKTFTKRKFDINTCMKDFLDFITKIYNMFCSMKFKEKVKCLFEMSFIALLLVGITSIIVVIAKNLLSNILDLNYIWPVFELLRSIFLLLLGTIDFIVFLHLFKIRYLNYFITIEDQNATQRTIEEPIEKQENKYYKQEIKEKVIIRDPKHTSFSFFEALEKVIVLIIKIFCILFAIPAIIGFVIIAALAAISIMYIMYGILFFWLTLAFLGILSIIYVILEWVYNFIFNKKQSLKRLFITIIIGLVLIGAGTGLTICTYLGFSNAGYDTNNYITQTENLKMTDKLVIEEKIASEFKYKIDNSMQDVQIEIVYPKEVESYLKKASRKDYDYYFVYANIEFNTIYKCILNDLKNKEITIYDRNAMCAKVTITTTEENCEKLKENYYNLYHKY